jgi:hypothetical protein
MSASRGSLEIVQQYVDERRCVLYNRAVFRGELS